MRLFIVVQVLVISSYWERLMSDHIIIRMVYLVRSGNGYASGHLSYGQASTYCPRHTYHVTVLVFVCTYVHTYDISTPFQNSTVLHYCSRYIGVIATVWIGVRTSLAHLCTILKSILSR